MKYPTNDNEFRDLTITKVSGDAENGWSITQDDGWSFWVPKDSPVTPEVGMAVRMYGEGNSVRGLFLNGTRVYYRTEKQDTLYRNAKMYGANAKEWLDRWDEGKSVWTIEMGGLGPSYEQCIHITAAEILRILLKTKPDLSKIETREQSAELTDKIDKKLFEVPVVKDLGLSGAQHGAAMNIACHLYRKGPIGVMTDDAVKDRHIQVSRTFPQG